MLFAPNNKGQGLVEYVVILALLALVIIVAGQVMALAAGGAEIVNALANTMK